MTDTAGQADIRGIEIDKSARAYQLEKSIFYNEVTVIPTSSRAVRWYQRTAGYLEATSPTDIVVAEGAKPWVLETSWTRNTSYVKKYMLDSPIITIEDETDSEVKVFMDNMQAIVDAIINKRDKDIYNVATENDTPVNINTNASTATWDAASGQNPAEDVAEAIQKIREETKQYISSPKLFVSAKGEKDLKTWLISVGAQFNEVASKVVESGIVSRFGGCEVVVSENVTADKALVGDLKQAVEYREFSPMKTVIIDEPLVGRKIRASTSGIAVLVKPKFLCLITNTEA